jgi:hypothetical protein
MSVITDKYINIKRLTKDLDNSDKESYQDNLALQSIACQIQPAGAEDVAISDGVYGQTFICFTTASGIRTGDHVTVSGTGELFRVRGIENWSEIDIIPHFEITLVSMEEEDQ